MIRTVKPRTARSKRALKERESKHVENTKKALFIPGNTCNKLVHDAMVDLHGLKKPDGQRFTRKNEIRPFEDPSSLEFFSAKNDCSLLVLGSHSKKRPNTLTFARTFNHQIYDMIELSILDKKLMSDFRKQTFSVGLKPMFVFTGSIFDEHPIFRHIKSLFLDFFRGETTDLLDPQALQHVIAVTATDAREGEALPHVDFRVYLLKTFKSSTPKAPRAELDEIGPRFEFRVGREQPPNPDVEKQALKKSRKHEERVKKNVETDVMGDKVGRIHMARQDLGQLATRKMKGLKRQFTELSDEEPDDSASSESESESD